MSNLNVTYTTQIAPGAAPATGVAATAGAPAADNPLGFLAALIDQMLAGGTEAVKTQAGAEGAASLSLPGLLNLALDTKTDTKVAVAPQGAGLLVALTKQLDALQLQLSAGEAPAPAQLDQLKDTIAALSAAIDAPLAVPQVDADTALDSLQAITAPVEVKPSLTDDQINQLLVDLGLIEPPADKPAPPATPAVKVDASADIAALRDQLLALSQSVAATAPDLSKKLEALADKLAAVEANAQLTAQLTPATPQADPDATTIAHVIRALLGEPNRADDAPKADANTKVTASAQHADELLQVLAQLGLSTTAPTTQPASTPVAASETVAASTAISATVPQPLLRLSAQLGKVSAALAATQPELAKKLEAVASRIVSTDVDANLLGQLTSAAKAGGDATALDRLVLSLIDNKPLPTPSPAPAAPPQIATVAKLDIPAPIAPKPTQSAVAEVKAAQPEPASVTADSAPAPQTRVSVAPISREPLSHPAPEARVEPKAASVIAETAKSDTPAPTTPSTPANAPAAQAAIQARILPAAYQPVANPINMGQVAFEMVRQIHQGTSRFTIRLDPPELGRVDVKMHVDGTGAVHARLAVERPETLDLFQRDQRSLERALAQAGLDGTKTNLEFSLRQNHQNPFSGMLGDQRQHQSNGGNAPRFSLNESDDVNAMPAITLYRGLASAGGVNIFA